MVENPATSSPGLAFLLGDHRPLRRERLARLLEQAPGQRREGRRRLGRGVRRRVLPGRRQGHVPARGVVRVEPAGGGVLREAAADDVADRHDARLVLPAGRVRRRAQGHRSTAAAARKLIDFMCPQRFQADMPLQMFVYPVRDGTPLPAVFAKFAECPTSRCRSRRRDRRATATSGSSSGPTPCCGERRARRGGASVAARLVPLAFLGVFFVYPVARSSGAASARRHARPRPARRRSSPTRAAARAVVHALAGRACRRVLTLAVALPGAYVLRPLRVPRASGRARALVTVPFVLPTVVVGAAFLALLGPGGPLGALGLDQTVWAILIAHVFFNYAVVVRTVGGLWAHLDPHQEEAARMLGAGRVARVPSRSRCRRCGRRSRPRPRSCSSSPSRRSA